MSSKSKGHLRQQDELIVCIYCDGTGQSLETDATGLCTFCRGKKRVSRNRVIIEMARSHYHRDGEVEVDETDHPEKQVSEGDDNGAYVQAWVWVEFTDTPLDKCL